MRFEDLRITLYADGADIEATDAEEETEDIDELQVPDEPADAESEDAAADEDDTEEDD